MARIVVPGVAHGLTQRGNGRMDAFFSREGAMERLSHNAE